MKVPVLCGGRGLIDPELPRQIAAGMVRIGDRPVVRNVRNTFVRYGHRELLEFSDGEDRGSTGPTGGTSPAAGAGCESDWICRVQSLGRRVSGPHFCWQPGGSSQ